MKEFDVSLSAAINGLISWAVFTLGIGVSFPILSILIGRILFGLLRLYTLGNVRFTFLCHSLPLAPPFGPLKHMAFTVSSVLELFLLLHLRLPRDSRRLLVPTYFSSTNAVGGPAFIWFPSWVVSVSVVFFQVLLSLIWVGVGTFGYTRFCHH